MSPTEAYALVTATFRGVRYVLLIERGDGCGWAMPVGPIEPDLDEDASMAAQRELFEQTGFDLIFYRGPNEIEVTTDEPRRMPDPNGAVTAVVRCDLGEVDTLPEVRGGDAAADAVWWPIAMCLAGGSIFSAHRQVLVALA